MLGSRVFAVAVALALLIGCAPPSMPPVNSGTVADPTPTPAAERQVLATDAQEPPQRGGVPLYTGEGRHVDEEGGYALWLPSDWHCLELVDGRRGMLFMPDAGDPFTWLTSERVALPFRVDQHDMPFLQSEFRGRLQSLPGIEVESKDERVSPTFLVQEARFTFLDGSARRKGWVRVFTWGEERLVLMAQGSTPEEFEYWLPMFYNTLMTVEF